MKGFVCALFIATAVLTSGCVDSPMQAVDRKSAEVHLRTINAQLIAYVKRMAADSVVTSEEMRNLIEGVEWFKDVKEEADSVLAESGERMTGTDIIPGLLTVASSYCIPFVRHRDTDASIVQQTLSRISGVPIRSVEDDVQGGSVLLVALAGVLCAALFLYGVRCDRVRYSLLATLLGGAGYLFIEARW